MGQYRFEIPASDHFTQPSLMTAQIVGLDGVPWPCQTKIDDQCLIISRNTDFSGRLLVSMRTSRGVMALTTGTLPEQPELYQLDLELARGTLSRLRNQVSLWREGGLEISPQFDQRVTELTERFSKAIFLANADDSDQKTAEYMAIVDVAVGLMFEITGEFGNQVAVMRSDQQEVESVAAGTASALPHEKPDLGRVAGLRQVERYAAPEILLSNGNLDIDFASIESVVDQFALDSAPQIFGPLIDFGSEQLPLWLDSQWAFDKRVQVANAMCRKMGERFAGKLKVIHVSAGLNGVGQQHFNYPQQIQVTLEMIESLDNQMTNPSLMVSFDQPWGERLAMSTGATQAIEIADSLLRYGARISALGLDICLDYWPHGTLIRDPLQWVDMIDRWSQFGLPLSVRLCIPNGGVAEETRFTKTIRDSLSVEQTTDYLDVVLRMLIGRPSVAIITWRHLTDAANSRFPLSGLFTEAGEAKELASWFAEFLLRTSK